MPRVRIDRAARKLRVSISLASAAGGEATGWLVQPRAEGRYPGLVLMHGVPGTAKQVMVSYGLPLATRGAVVIAWDAPWARRRGLPDVTPRDSAEQAQLIRDLRRAVDVLSTRRNVDSTRIGYVGGSYGGAVGVLCIAVEPRLKAAVLFVPDGGLVSRFTAVDGSATGPLAELPEEQRTRWLRAMWPIEPIRFVHERARIIPLLVQSARKDALAALTDAEELRRALPQPVTVLWYDVGHGWMPTATRERNDWIMSRLARR